MNVEQFEQYRPLLFSLAYRMLGTVADAEDIVQDAFLRVHDKAAELIEKPKYYLTTTVTRLCLNQLSAARTQREEYLGPWLPEPLYTDERPELVNPLERTLANDSISVAFLVLLESLSPAERAVFLLHEVFDYSHQEIAEMLDKSEGACRQLLRRGKRHITANHPRYALDREQHERLLHEFVEVTRAGELNGFLEMLVEDVTLVPDGGGERGAATRILRGREAVAAFILGVRRMEPVEMSYDLVTLNGQRAILTRTQDGRPYYAVFLYESPEDKRQVDKWQENESGDLSAAQDGQTKRRVHMIYVVAGRKLRGL